MAEVKGFLIVLWSMMAYEGLQYQDASGVSCSAVCFWTLWISCSFEQVFIDEEYYPNTAG